MSRILPVLTYVHSHLTTTSKDIFDVQETYKHFDAFLIVKNELK
jgi:hypothetical protein